MVKKVMLTGLLILFSFSCTHSEKKCNNENLYFYTIENEILKEQILLYKETVPLLGIEEKMINVVISYISYDSIVYNIRYHVSALGTVLTSSTLFAQLDDGTVVAVSFVRKKDIMLPEDVAWMYLKDTFKDEYARVLSGQFPIGPTLEDVIWRLTFSRGKLVSKEEVFTIYP